MLTKSYRSISKEEFAVLIDSLTVVVITVTTIEKDALHERLEPLPGNTEIFVVQKHILTYYVGLLGRYIVCHVESKMGSIGAGASITTTQQAIEYIKPKMIIMLGIAFGVNENEQNIGDVLISEQIVQYESKKVKDGIAQSREFKQMSSTLLFNRFTHPIGWKFKIARNKFSKIIGGNILSGEVLVDDIDYREQLVNAFAPVIGGEMEGAGLVSAAHSYHKHWLVVKGLCDYADGNKSIKKSSRQRIAARAAVDLCLTVFKDKYTFRDLDVVPFSEIPIQPYDSSADNKIDVSFLPDVLFNTYSINKEKFYYERQLDKVYGDLVASGSHIWSFGKSGVGKTCISFRNLMHLGKDLCVVDLSGCSSKDIISVSEYIHYRILEKVGIRKSVQANSLALSIDNICHDIDKYLQGFCIVFEEIPLSSNENEVVEYLFSIVIKNGNMYPDSTSKFVFTSIGNPRECIPMMSEKIGEKVSFLEIIPWTAEELNSLLELILKAVNCKLDDRYRMKIVEVAKGIPRNLKNEIKSMLMFIQRKINPFEIMVSEHFKTKYNYVK